MKLSYAAKKRISRMEHTIIYSCMTGGEHMGFGFGDNCKRDGRRDDDTLIIIAIILLLIVLANGNGFRLFSEE